MDVYWLYLSHTWDDLNWQDRPRSGAPLSRHDSGSSLSSLGEEEMKYFWS